MDELSRRIREANPYAGQPLSPRAQQTLDDIMSGRRTPRLDSVPVQPPPRRAPVLIALSAFAITATLVLFVAFAVVKPQAAFAVMPAPLLISPTDETLDMLREAVMSTPPHDSDVHSDRGAQWEGWYFQFDDDTSRSYIQPERTQVTWRPDLSGSSRVTAGAPVDSFGAVIQPIPDGAAEPGTTLYEEIWGAGELLLPFIEIPPEDPNAMRAYLDSFLGDIAADPAHPRAEDYVMAITSLKQVWTLSPAADRAAIAVVLESAGVSVAGETIDRAGRAGILLDLEPADPSSDLRTQLIIDNHAWRILAVEATTSSGIPDYRIPPGSVTEYTIWR